MRPWIWIVWLLALVGCAAKEMPRASSYGAEAESYEDFAVGEAEADFAGGAQAAPAPMASRSKVMDDRATKPPPATVAPVKPSRMVHYDGYARMRATRPAETLDRIAKLAVDAGGRVDRLADTQATVRVPVDAFEEVWQAVLALGDVLDKRIRADDITEQFRATDLRVATLRTMHQRLVKLLARARSEEEKLALLKQITRVTEELDRTESQLRALRDLASMSRISVDVVPRQFGPRRGALTLAGFEWIRTLSPFNRGVYDDDKRIELPTPPEMVSLTKRGPYIAESPDHTVLWTMRVDNDPRGDADFWRTAIHEALASDFEDVEMREVGDWACSTFDEPGSDEPYRWQICLDTARRHVQVVQAFFPGPEQVERFGDRVDAALTGGGDA